MPWQSFIYVINPIHPRISDKHNLTWQDSAISSTTTCPWLFGLLTSQNMTIQPWLGIDYNQSYDHLLIWIYVSEIILVKLGWKNLQKLKLFNNNTKTGHHQKSKY